MKIPSLAACVLLLSNLPALPVRADDAPPKRVVATVTRTILQFGTLENDWLDAVQKRDATAIKNLMADDFEMRVAAAPGQPTPREQVLAHTLAEAPFQSSIEQMATHEHGDLVIVSFLWKLQPAKGSALAQRIFVVDTWKQGDGHWQVLTRYAAPVGTQGGAVPGADLSAPTSKKKI